MFQRKLVLGKLLLQLRGLPDDNHSNHKDYYNNDYNYQGSNDNQIHYTIYYNQVDLHIPNDCINHNN